VGSGREEGKKKEKGHIHTYTPTQRHTCIHTNQCVPLPSVSSFYLRVQSTREGATELTREGETEGRKEKGREGEKRRQTRVFKEKTNKNEQE
jgi:hypothetical protein